MASKLYLYLKEIDCAFIRYYMKWRKPGKNADPIDNRSNYTSDLFGPHDLMHISRDIVQCIIATPYAQHNGRVTDSRTIVQQIFASLKGDGDDILMTRWLDSGLIATPKSLATSLYKFDLLVLRRMVEQLKRLDQQDKARLHPSQLSIEDQFILYRMRFLPHLPWIPPKTMAELESKYAKYIFERFPILTRDDDDSPSLVICTKAKRMRCSSRSPEAREPSRANRSSWSPVKMRRHCDGGGRSVKTSGANYGSLDKEDYLPDRY